MHIHGCSIKGECPHMRTLEIDSYPTQVCMNGNTWCDKKLGEIPLMTKRTTSNIFSIGVTVVVSMEVSKLSDVFQTDLKEIVKELLSKDERLRIERIE